MAEIVTYLKEHFTLTPSLSGLTNYLLPTVNSTMTPFGGATLTLSAGADSDGDACVWVEIHHIAAGNAMGPQAANLLSYQLQQLAIDAGEERIIYVKHKFHTN